MGKEYDALGGGNYAAKRELIEKTIVNRSARKAARVQHKSHKNISMILREWKRKKNVGSKMPILKHAANDVLIIVGMLKEIKDTCEQCDAFLDDYQKRLHRKIALLTERIEARLERLE